MARLQLCAGGVERQQAVLWQVLCCVYVGLPVVLPTSGRHDLVKASLHLTMASWSHWWSTTHR